ncbi:tetratricopeptide repeat protein [Streptomyces roseirectus]|uniref:Tetratricopeptide repeat protein n=1 Tax=Streptomyces roseirectus TaxID=2768066 RepID=A0A7H0I5Q9_9ACTN|nr:tetratricopeptide repeat protein [Streptomyces roseirectus]QNP68125.1 tetratricopeptide repeat protein [Streptomyces roseirectus]
MAKQLGPVLLATGAAVVVVLPGILAAARLRSPAIAASAVGLAAIAAVFAGFWKDGLLHRFQQDRENAAFVRDGCLTMGGELPAVRDVAELTRLGVHAARRGTSRTTTSQPPYVPRDIDDELREHLAASGAFVLIVGDSTAGKSRAAYEGLTATLPQHTLIAPQTRTALPYAIEQTAGSPRAALWLDDLERFLGEGGLSRNMLTRFLDTKGQHRVVLATIRAGELDTYLRTDNGSRPLNREVLDALALAHRIDLPRMFSPAERDRAATRTWDPRIEAALDHADRFGIAEYLSAGPELLHRWHAARDGGEHVRGAALVSAAVDCRRAGVTAPLPRAVLEELAVHHLPRRGGTPYPGEALAQAWEWATDVRTTTALLTPVDADTVDVYDYLVDETASPVSDTVLTTVLGFADAADTMRIGTIARAHGRYAIALDAYERVRDTRIASLGDDDPDTLTSRGHHAAVLRVLGRLREAEAEHRAVLEARVRVLGPDDPATLVSRNNLALALRDLDRLEEAEAQHRIVSDVRMRDLGESHPATLTNRNNHAFVLHDLGQAAEAEAEHCAVLAAYERLLDAADATPNTAAVLKSLGRLEDAEAEQHTVLDTSTRVFDPDHPDALTSRGSPTLVLHAVERLGEAERMHRAVYEGYARVLGPDHPSTLTSRENLAVVLHARGKVAEAEREHRAVVDHFARVLGPDHPSTLTSRCNLAVVLQALGRAPEAEKEHRAVLEAFTRLLGPDHPSTLTSRNYLAALLLSQDKTAQAEAEQRVVLEGFGRVLGPEHSSTLTSRGNLGVVLHALGRYAEAEPELRAALEGFARRRGPLHPSTLSARSNHAAALHSLGLVTEAESELRAVLDGFTAILGADHPRTLRARETLRRGGRRR